MGIPSWKDFYFYFMNNISEKRYEVILYEITLIRPKDNEIRDTPLQKEYKHTRKKSQSNKKEKETIDLIIKRRTLFIITKIIPLLFLLLIQAFLFCPFVLCNYFFISFISFTRIGAVTLSFFKSTIQKTLKISTA